MFDLILKFDDSFARLHHCAAHTHISNMRLQATLVYIAKTYGIFEHGTRAKTIKASRDVLSKSKFKVTSIWGICAGTCMLQDWAGHWGGQIRSMCVHTLDLAKRSKTSRSRISKKIFFYFEY